MSDSSDLHALLLLEPGADADSIRRAYAKALKRIEPDSDPDAFQALREARDTLLRAVDTTATVLSEAEATEAERIVAAIRRKRRAGDVAGAIAFLDRFLAEQPAASPLTEAVNLRLFEQMSLERVLAPALFRAFADRFNWRDAAGATARADPDRHAIVAERIAAEDWFGSLVRAAGEPSDQIARTLLADPPGSISPSLNREGREAALRVMSRLRSWDQFLLSRFDPRNLVALRDAVQGPAYVAPALHPAAVSPPAPQTKLTGWQKWRGAMGGHPQRRRFSLRQSLVLVAIGGAIALGQGYFGDDTSASRPGRALDPALLRVPPSMAAPCPGPASGPTGGPRSWIFQARCSTARPCSRSNTA